MNMKQSCKALICAIEGELDGRHCTEEQAAAILDHALPSLTEALARVEAERDAALAKAPTQWAYDQACRTLHKHREIANTAQALLREVDAYLSGHGDNAICNGSRLHRDIKDLLAGQLAVAGTTSDQYRAELYDEVWQKARDMGYGNVTDALVALELMKASQPKPVAIANRGKGAFWVKWTDAAEGLYGPGIKLYTAPPAAAHGDEAVQYRLLRVGEIILATDELLRDDCTTWTPMSEGRQLGIGWKWHEGLMPMRRIDAAMSAQGEGD